MMKKYYDKSELSFAIGWIVLYCVLQSAANPLDAAIGTPYFVSALFCAVQAVVLFGFLKRNGLMEKYGLCRPKFSAGRFFFYVPLMILTTTNFWNGAAVNMPPRDTVCYLLCMLFVGFVEEIIFRGFLFKAMEKDNAKRAVAVTSLTFGLGHLLNLVNGSGAEPVETLFQVIGAIAMGFLFVTLFDRGGSLWPCILSHSLINMTSAFGRQSGLTVERQMLFQLILFVVATVYALVLARALPGKDRE